MGFLSISRAKTLGIAHAAPKLGHCVYLTTGFEGLSGQRGKAERCQTLGVSERFSDFGTNAKPHVFSPVCLHSQDCVIIHPCPALRPLHAGR